MSGKVSTSGSLPDESMKPTTHSSPLFGTGRMTEASTPFIVTLQETLVVVNSPCFE